MDTPSEKSIFLEALEQETPAARQRYLQRACAGQPELRAAVDDLLVAHERSENVLDHVPQRVGEWRLGWESVPAESSNGPEDRLVGPASDSMDEGPGTIIGPYRLMEQIGEGGFGRVFVAQQQQPVRRKVALKVIKPGMDTREVIARFEAERQALAMMDHPNIAQVFDAGATDTGRPYFVMELVRGVAITQFCDQVQNTTRDRLELFVHVCHAVQHAHQKGVIHRDLKPGNVLVTLHDGTPVVKVIDFGVAKAIGEPLTAKTIYTRFAQMIGTPLYMSPEQVEMSGLDVDTRSDIYSLGVLLYELLTGTTPLDRQRLQTASFDELRRMIREEEPPRPSTRLTTLGQQLSTLSANRRVDARNLSSTVQGDLDWIVMRAMEKDRRRRYETAAEFAADVRRYLNEEPIEARPPSPLYRFHKFARRNRVILTTASLVISALLLGTTVSTWQAIRATSAQADADALRREAVDFADRLKEANVLLDSARANADEHRWAAAYDQYTKAAELQPDHYLVWSGRGSMYLRLGLWTHAGADYAKALELGAPANNPSWWGVPQLCLYTDHRDAYRIACTEMLRHALRSSDGFFINPALRSCLVSESPVADPLELARLAEQTLTTELFPPFGPGFYGTPPPGFGPKPPPDRQSEPPRVLPMGPPTLASPQRLLQCYVAGLAHYRAGHAQQAINRLRESEPTKPYGLNYAIGSPVLAMAYHRAGRLDEARHTLAQADRTIDQWIKFMADGQVGSFPVMWFDFIEFQLLHREASRLINGAPPGEDARLKLIERRALAALHAS